MEGVGNDVVNAIGHATSISLESWDPWTRPEVPALLVMTMLTVTSMHCRYAHCPAFQVISECNFWTGSLQSLQHEGCHGFTAPCHLGGVGGGRGRLERERIAESAGICRGRMRYIRSDACRRVFRQPTLGAQQVPCHKAALSAHHASALEGMLHACMLYV